MSDVSLPFVELAPGVGIGAPAPGAWVSVAELPLLVLVGVTGVGKSTTLEALEAAQFRYALLPDRRGLTDQLIIPAMQARAGQPPGPVKDRKLRFEYTRTYREVYSGGMAYALAQLCIDPALTIPSADDGAGETCALVFDGLRGENEVEHAAALLPLARFVVLEAPDVTRVARLMGRGDPFDQIGGERVENPTLDQLQHFADIGAGDAAPYFSHLEEQALLELVRTGSVTAEALRDSLAIVTEERRNYDPAAAAAALRRVAPDRTLVVNTVRFPPDQVAAQIVRFADVTL